MVGRCHNENWNNYFTKTYYRDKGIVVCDEWRYSFENFKAWALENGYEDNLSIDRIDANGNYEPSNCRWITYEENRRLGLANARLSRCGSNQANQNKLGKWEVRLWSPTYENVQENNFATKKDAKAYLEKLPKKTSIGLKTVHLSYFVCKMEKDSKKGKFYEKEELIRRRQNERVRKKRKT